MEKQGMEYIHDGEEEAFNWLHEEMLAASVSPGCSFSISEYYGKTKNFCDFEISDCESGKKAKIELKSSHGTSVNFDTKGGSAYRERFMNCASHSDAILFMRSSGTAYLCYVVQLRPVQESLKPLLELDVIQDLNVFAQFNLQSLDVAGLKAALTEVIATCPAHKPSWVDVPKGPAFDRPRRFPPQAEPKPKAKKEKKAKAMPKPSLSEAEKKKRKAALQNKRRMSRS